MSANKKPAKTVDMEQMQKQLQELLAKGKKEGMIRAADLNALLEKMTLTTEKIEEIYDRFDAMGIQMAQCVADAATLLVSVPIQLVILRKLERGQLQR